MRPSSGVSPRAAPSVILVREWEQQMSSSGCCGRLEGDFLGSGPGSEPGRAVFSERRATMEAMGPLYRAIRERFGDDVEIEVVDPRSFPTLIALLLRDFRRYGVRPGEAWRTLSSIPVQGVLVNGRLVSAGSWPAAGTVIELLEEYFADSQPARSRPSAGSPPLDAREI